MHCRPCPCFGHGADETTLQRDVTGAQRMAADVQPDFGADVMAVNRAERLRHVRDTMEWFPKPPAFGGDDTMRPCLRQIGGGGTGSMNDNK